MTSRKNLINRQTSTLQPATLERVSRLRQKQNAGDKQAYEGIPLEDAPDSRIARRLKKKLQRKMNRGRK